MKIHIRVEPEGASLAIKSNLRPTYLTLNSGEHSIELGEGELLVLHDGRRDPNHPSRQEELSNLPPDVVAIPDDEPPAPEVPDTLAPPDTIEPEPR